MLLAPAEMAKEFKKTPVRIAGIGQATDTQAVHERPDPTELTAVRLAARAGLRDGGLTPKDIHVAELHDAFTILEIAESEEVGFFKKGEGHKALERGETQDRRASCPSTRRAGSRRAGIPVGQHRRRRRSSSWSLQLRGEAGERPGAKKPKHGFACNFGGFGNNVVATVLKRGV